MSIERNDFVPKVDPEERTLKLQSDSFRERFLCLRPDNPRSDAVAYIFIETDRDINGCAVHEDASLNLGDTIALRDALNVLIEERS